MARTGGAERSEVRRSGTLIFVAVGTQLPFDRLVHAVDAWAHERGRDDVFAQVGPTKAPPRWIRSVAFMPPREFEEAVKASTCIVAHAGMGTILSALMYGKLVVVMPRLARLREQRNDHQLATTRRLAERGLVHAAHDAVELVRALDGIDQLASHRVARMYASDELLIAIETFVNQDQLLAPKPTILSPE